MEDPFVFYCHPLNFYPLHQPTVLSDFQQKYFFITRKQKKSLYAEIWVNTYCASLNHDLELIHCLLCKSAENFSRYKFFKFVYLGAMDEEDSYRWSWIPNPHCRQM